MFDEVEMIELDQISNDEYLIKSLNPVELSKIKQSNPKGEVCLPQKCGGQTVYKKLWKKCGRDGFRRS